MCKCGLNHRGWEGNLCRIELAKKGGALLSPIPKQTLLCDPGDLVLAKKPKNKPVSTNGGNPSKPVSTNATRQAAFKNKKIAAGVLLLKIWSHPDDMAAIKKYAKELDGNRSKVS